MTVAFRQATPADIPAVVALLRDDDLGRDREGLATVDYVAAFHDMSGDDNNYLIVGEAGDQIVATYQLTFIRGLSLRAARRAQMESVRVASDMRGRGIGEAMIKDAEIRARSAECSLMQLTMNASRTDSARFYERVGFTPSHIGYKRDLI